MSRRLFRIFVLALNLAAPLVAVWLWLQGHPICAVLLIMTAHALVLIPTLIPSCGWLGRIACNLKQASSPPPTPSTVWLTIDDGPDPDDTPVLLDILDQHHAVATFFFIGEKAAQYPDLVREVVRRGHTVGNHTFTHPQTSFWAYGPTAVKREIKTCQQLLTDLCGNSPISWFRAPAGLKNPFVQAYAEELGLGIACWNARGLDGVERYPAKVLSRLKDQIKEHSIILMHEGRTTLSGDRLAPLVLVDVLEFLAQQQLKTALPH